MNVQKEGILIKIKNHIDFLLIALVIIPLILFALHFLLPEELKEKLVLHRDYVTGYEIFTKHFIHSDLEHLKLNVVGYIVAIISLYGLLYFLNEKRLFWILFVLNLSIIPIVISIIWIPINKYIVKFEKTCGFSGIVLSFLGMVIHSFFHFFYKKFGINLLNYSFLIFIIVSCLYLLSSISQKVVLSDFISPLLIIILLIISLFIFLILPLIHTRELKRSLLFLLYAIWFFSSLCFTFSAFPFPPKNVNIDVHYIGFVVGFLTNLYLLSKSFI